VVETILAKTAECLGGNPPPPPPFQGGEKKMTVFSP